MSRSLNFAIVYLGVEMKKIEILRHSCAHLLAAAVNTLYPKTKFGIGPSIETGFYYDFDLSAVASREGGFTPSDLPLIERKMKEIQGRDLKFEKKVVSKKEAEKIFKEQPYKLELLKEIPDKEVTIYKTGDFVDLCQGPHKKSTKEIGVFKLLSLAGAYWKGSEKNPMLLRIYGTCFETQKDLEEYLEKMKEAEKRDHRKLGRDLELFSISSEFGAGLPLWHPKGALILKIIKDYLTDLHLKEDYQIVETPHIALLSLWKKSGHLDFYKEYLYSPIKIENSEYLLKPMNCLGHIKIYQNSTRSYKDLPIKYAEFGTVYRYERAGVLHGLLRVRGFTQDDAHIFCSEEQMEEELVKVLKFAQKILSKFDFKDYEVKLSTRPLKYIGSEEIWNKAEKALKNALLKSKLKYEIDKGEGVFYGPKIDIKIKDSLGRLWQCSTIQLDFNLPERFKVLYIDKDGRAKKVIMIHRAILGSLERFVGVLLEHTNGALPFWLSPLQVVVLPITSRHLAYAKVVEESLEDRGLRIEIDERNETLEKKIRDWELQKVPYMLVVGDKEIKKSKVKSQNWVAVRDREKGDLGQVELIKFVKMIE